MAAVDRLSAPAPGLRVGVSWPLIVGACAFLAILARPALLLIDPDVYWHVTAGRWIIDHLAIPVSDPFSHTLRDAPWTAHEWLSEVVLAGAYAAGGWAGTVILTAAAFAAALAILARYLLRHLEPIYALLFTAMSASLLVPHLLARPHALMAPILVAWGAALVRAREGDTVPPWWLGGLMALWANIHGSFVLGLALAAILAFEAILAAVPGPARRSELDRWALFLCASTIASMLTPWGPRGLMFAFEVDQMSFALSVIGEWQSVNFQQFHPLGLWLLVGGGAILFLGLKLPPVRIFLLLGLLYLALKHARHADVLALLAPLVIAESFAGQLANSRKGGQQAARLDQWFAALVPAARPATAGIVLALLFMAGWSAARGGDSTRPAVGITPEAAMQAAKSHGVRGPVLNAYEFGGYLIFSGTPPFIDGRTDLYGDAFLKAYIEAIDLRQPDLLPQLLEKHDIDWTLLRPGTPAVALLDHLPGWRRLYADKTAVVHVRERALPDGQRNAL